MLAAHEILRAAAFIVEAGWASGCDAQDATGRQVPLYGRDVRAMVNVAAVRFSAYGAICKAMSQSKRQSLARPCGRSCAIWRSRPAPKDAEHAGLDPASRALDKLGKAPASPDLWVPSGRMGLSVNFDLLPASGFHPDLLFRPPPGRRGGSVHA